MAYSKHEPWPSRASDGSAFGMVPFDTILNDNCTWIRETHSAPRTASTTAILANHHNGFCHRAAHFPSLPQILKVENILYNCQYSSSDLPPIYFSHSHLFTKCRGSIWELTVTYSSHSGFKEHVSMAPNTHSQMAKLDQLSSGKCLCFHINLSLLCSFLLL